MISVHVQICDVHVLNLDGVRVLDAVGWLHGLALWLAAIIVSAVVLVLEFHLKSWRWLVLLSIADRAVLLAWLVIVPHALLALLLRWLVT